MKYLQLGLCAALLLLCAIPARAQLDGARVQWPLPKNLNLLAVHRLSGTVNATLNNLSFVEPSLNIENQLYLLTYSRSQPVFGRSALFTAVLPAGLLETRSALPLTTSDPFVHGLGDPSLGATVNLFGAPGLMLREYQRYDLGTAVSFGLNAVFPIGQYDSEEPLNLGSHQWKLRFALPVVRSLAAWVPGGRTTLELTPSLTWLSDNDDRMGESLAQDPLLAVEAHLTRDVTRRAFISADYSYLRFGASTSTSRDSGVVVDTTPAADAHLLGATVSFQINDNLNLFVTHMQTLGGGESPVALEGALFRATLTWSFHRVIERRRSFSGS